MAYGYGAFSLLLTRRLHLSSSLHPKPCFSLSHLLTKPFSTTPPDPNPNPKPSSLSARLSFVFDQIDAIEKERSQKHETLQRIRAWRQSKDAPPQNESQPEPALSLPDETPPEPPPKKAVELVHPWPEWIQLMEVLVHQNYFDHRRRDEDKMVHDLGFDPPEVAEGIDFTKDFKSVHMACLNLGRDRFDILRSLSRKDIQVLVGYGCPTVDRKVVFSAKLLRKHVHLDEGDVCSSCSLRNNCERAYLLTNKEDEARTLDVMRLLLTFGFDPVDGSVINKSLFKQKSVKTVVRKLLHEVVKLSSVPIDPNLPPPVIKKLPPKVKQPPPPPKRRIGRDDVEMKKGDWLCPKCEFMNFAKNTACLQCDAKRPKRQLLPGEWECPECNFLNYRRNMVCFHCECKRPPDEFLENKMQDRIQSSKPKLDKMGSRQEVFNAWNFDFDDNESDGADVAAFEYADPHAIHEEYPSHNNAQHGNHRGWEDNFAKNNRVQGSPDGEYATPDFYKPGIGFDDFEDEDDIDSYELETTQNSSRRMETSKHDLSEDENWSESEDNGGSDHKRYSRHKTTPQRGVQSRSFRKNTFSGSEDDKLDFVTDEQRSTLSNFKSRNVSTTDRRRNARGPSKKLSYGSESEDDSGAGLYSDEDDDLHEAYSFRKNNGDRFNPSRQTKGDRHDSGRRNFTKTRKSGSFGGRRENMFSDDFDGSSQQYYKNSRSSKGNGRNRNGFEDFDGPSRGSFGDGRGSRGRNDHGGSSRGSFGNGRGSRGNDRSGQRFKDREHGAGRLNKYRMDEKDSGEFRNSRRVIER
ncbi:unnamed protein product [Sphenostylis stenocarpa]|uniref:RanBP2-type domain-containing protein n=1 Tax=Sphenostylis stenocarpa TaxID=92480 RepID=A0AA86SZ94_9FABA|nr:unnamed protein product [Sphenostylis stenocarpa]